MCSYSLDPITLISRCYLQGMMSGLSPDALCRIFQYLLSIQITLNQSSKSKVSFDAIKKLLLLLAARSALNLYECAVSASNADLTL